MKQQIVRDSTTDYLELKVWDHNAQVVPTAALISIIVDGATIQSLASATISASGTCTFYPTSTAIDLLTQNCVANWKLTIDTVPRYYRQLFDVVLHPLYAVLTDEDLISECAALQDAFYMEAGLVDSGTRSTLVSVLLQEYQDNHFEGGTLEITDGAAAGAKVTITAHAKSTGTLTFSPSLPTTVDATSRFVARRTFQREIDRAWEDVEQMIQTKGYRPALIVNAEDLRPVHAAWTLVKICRALAKNQEDIWWTRAEAYAEDYQSRLGLMNFEYDADEDEWPETVKTFKPGFRR